MKAFKACLQLSCDSFISNCQIVYRFVWMSCMVWKVIWSIIQVVFHVFILAYEYSSLQQRKMRERLASWRAQQAARTWVAQREFNCRAHQAWESTYRHRYMYDAEPAGDRPGAQNLVRRGEKTETTHNRQLSQLFHTAITLAHSGLFSGYSHTGLFAGSLESASVKTYLA